MLFKTRNLLVSAALLATLTAGVATTATAQNMAHAHMGHVTDSWGDTPDGKGLLPTAIAEAEIAVFHATLASKQLDNLEWMQTHAQHVLHAIDPEAVAGGPGLGYGVKAASLGVAKHIGFAAGAEEASENVKLHAVHVASSANNTAARVAEIVGYIDGIGSATSAEAAAPLVNAMLLHAMQLLDGRDANGDGSVTWQEDEGGLLDTQKHMGFMRTGEDL